MLKNVVGLVTGGASGLGKATVDRFIREGAKVTLVDLPTSKGHEIAEKLGEDRCIFVPADITKEADIINALEATKAKFHRLNVAVSCAGKSKVGISQPFITLNKKSRNHRYWSRPQDLQFW